MYRALLTFSGLITMVKGEVREITNKELVEDLLHAGYIEKEKTTKEEIKKTDNKKNS